MKKCDLVMKGGITSGIVYPGAVCELAKEFRFVNIGGTSAGAIAAALTAAAEVRRQNGGGAAGFDEVATLPAWLGGSDGGRSRLLALFQPSRETAPLLEVLMAWLESGSVLAALRVLVTRFMKIGLVVALAGLLVTAIAAASGVLLLEHSQLLAMGAMLSALLALGATIAAVVLAAAIEALRYAMRILPRNGFGICSGRTSGGRAALTDWLSARIDEIAGVAGPLTFGDLWRAGGGDADGRGVNLEMMTTNLTHGRPYRLPLDGRNVWFAATEMRRLFPERIVDWMIAKSGPEARRLQTPAGEELYRLPAAIDLPVVVATRMSLSFPILLSAVPLWSIDFARRGRRAAERCWFSDGGITSNFPVHFFDAPLPRWPTFAINLAERSERYHDEGQRIYVPRSNRGGIQEWWAPFTTLPGFIVAIVNTMQNWRDNMLLHLPGQRDRIAHVLLAPHEGGLNLTMSAGTIEQVAGRGAEAGRAFRERFGSAPPAGTTLTWANHKWVRYLTFMGALEPALASWSRAFDDITEPPAFRELLGGPLPSYKLRPQELDVVRSTSLRFLSEIAGNFGTRPFGSPRRRPRGNATLRVMPRE